MQTSPYKVKLSLCLHTFPLYLNTFFISHNILLSMMENVIFFYYYFQVMVVACNGWWWMLVVKISFVVFLLLVIVFLFAYFFHSFENHKTRKQNQRGTRMKYKTKKKYLHIRECRIQQIFSSTLSNGGTTLLNVRLKKMDIFTQLMCSGGNSLKVKKKIVFINQSCMVSLS